MDMLKIVMLAFRRYRFHLVRKLHLLWGSLIESRMKLSQRSIQFQCNICGHYNEKRELVAFDRELASCASCSSNLRYRAIIDILSNYLYGKSVALVEFPMDKSIIGLGVSDWKGYAEILGTKFSYINTFFHTEPRLDITDIPSSEHGKYDFVIVSDVLEHIDTPVSKGFCNLFNLLKPKGICIITVPFMNFEMTLEHFPDLNSYHISQHDGRRVLINATLDGRVQTFTELEFHGGCGATLEKRIFTRRSLQKELTRAGFDAVDFCRRPNLGFGIKWIVNWSLPISAIKKS
ncbi:MAG: methyltransferase domain-containing protein [Desulfobulbaceae bacterium]|nr:methyltransferase domain-containing protein [Desulfobulbaceae bacterium]